MRVAEARQRDLALCAGHAIRVAGHDHPVVFDVDAGELARGVAVLAQIGHGELGTELRHLVQADLHVVCGQVVGIGRRGVDGQRQRETGGGRCGHWADDGAVVVKLDLPNRRGATTGGTAVGSSSRVVHVPGVVGGGFLEVQAHGLGNALAVIHVDRRAIGGARCGRHGRGGGGVACGVGGPCIQVEGGRDGGGLLRGNRLCGGEHHRNRIGAGAQTCGRVHGVAHHLGAVVGDHVAHLVQLEVAGARIGRSPVWQLQGEEAVAVDGHVQAIASDAQVALRELLRDGCHFHAYACIGAAG